jgi:hypothetical protein
MIQQRKENERLAHDVYDQGKKNLYGDTCLLLYPKDY